MTESRFQATGVVPKTTTRFRLNPVMCAALMAAGVGVGVDARAQAAPAPALAASAAKGSGASASDQVDTQSVVITANKRSERQREVAGTVSVVQGSDLENRGAQDQEDFFKLLPGVQFNKGDADRALPTIRGVGTVQAAGNLSVQQATTGIYIEDVPFTDPHAFVATADLAPFDLERVEVLQGPQGALYGSASLGGAIRYVLMKPDLKSLEGSVLTSVDGVSHGGLGYSAYGMLNVPLSDDVAGIRMVAFDRHDSGYIRNLGTGRSEANVLNQDGGRIIGLIKPDRDLKVTATLLTQLTRIDDGGAVSPDPTRLDIDTPTASPRDTRYTLADVQVDWDLGGRSLSSTTAFINKRSDGRTDATRLVGNIGAAAVDPSLPALSPVSGPNDANSHSFSQEFRLSSTGDGPFSYLGGLFYQHSTYGAFIDWSAPGGAAAWGAEGALLPNDTLLLETDRSTSSETAAFADLQYRFQNGIAVDAGGRYFRNHETFDSVANFFGTSTADVAKRESGFTPKLSVKYVFAPDQVLYGLVSKGYRVGGANLAPSATVPTYAPDSLWNYETGLRLAAAKDLHFDFSLYDIDWKNAQVNSRDATGFNVIRNVGQARVKGVEANAQYQATRALSLVAAVAYTDARTTTDFTGANTTLVPSGTMLPGTAKFQSSLQANLDFQGPAGSFGRFNLTHSFVGPRRLAIDSPGMAAAYQLLDSRVTFSVDHWELGLFMNNIFDKLGVTGAQVNAGFGNPSYTDYYLTKPRTTGITLRYDL
jgi:iron complex outermembrane recepter protein